MSEKPPYRVYAKQAKYPWCRPRWYFQCSDDWMDQDGVRFQADELIVSDHPRSDPVAVGIIFRAALTAAGKGE